MLVCLINFNNKKQFHKELFFIIGNENLIGYTYISIRARIFRVINKNRWRTDIVVLNENTEMEYSSSGRSVKYCKRFGKYILEE